MGRLARPILAVSACGDKQKEPQGLPHGSPQVGWGQQKGRGVAPTALGVLPECAL